MNKENLAQSKIIVAICGGVAAYKAVDLIRRLKEKGAIVRVVLTAGAQQFITPLTCQAVSGLPVHSDLFDCTAEAAMSHIELARWADWLLIVPATADVIARIAHGIANDLLTTLYLATTAKVAIVPAMNQQMWAHPQLQANIAHLSAQGVLVWGPASGVQACGDVGLGRMLEVADILEVFAATIAKSPGRLVGKKVVITAGPTYEPIDPVRYIGNRSSGKMGFALASAFAAEGAKVVLIAGPVKLQTPQYVSRIDVETAAQMWMAVENAITGAAIFVGVAAVADYTIANTANQKIKKSDEALSLVLTPTTDIIKSVAALPQRPYIVGFAAETEQLIAHARAKRVAKNMDLIIANQVGNELSFDQDDNEVIAIWATGETYFPRQNKETLAKDLVSLIVDQLFRAE